MCSFQGWGSDFTEISESGREHLLTMVKTLDHARRRKSTSS